MKFAVALAALAGLASAATSSINIVLESSDPNFNGNGTSSIHEGAGINYMLVSYVSQGQTFDYDSSAGTISYPLTDEITTYFSSYGGIYQVSVYDSGYFYSFDSDGYLLANGTIPPAYACKNMNDPYQYTTYSYGLANVTSTFSDCHDVKLKKVDVSSSSTTSSSTLVPVTTSSAVPTHSYPNATSTGNASIIASATYTPITVTTNAAVSNNAANGGIFVGLATFLFLYMM
ncbi:hypothetical protein V1511DRAFT_496156 [Dipodascopsis uninucleata]